MSEKKTTSIDGVWHAEEFGEAARLVESEGSGGPFALDVYFLPGPLRDGLRARFRITVEILDEAEAEVDRAAEWDRIYGHAK